PLDGARDGRAGGGHRAPALDLSSLYAADPSRRPEFYGRQLCSPYRPSNSFLLGRTTPSTGQNIRDPLPNDLPRNSVGRALIVDARNDDNLVLAQLQLAFLKFHNAVVNHLEATRPDLDGVDQFNEAKRIVTWHYQWIVLFDHVERRVGPGLIEQMRRRPGRRERDVQAPFQAADLVATALALHHATLQPAYDYNRVHRAGGPFAAATPALLAGFTGGAGAIVGDLRDDAHIGDTGHVPGGKLRALPGNRIIDWRRFFEIGGTLDPNRCQRLDARVAPGGGACRSAGGGGAGGGVGADTALGILQHGVQLGLPCGQDVAQFMGLPVLTADDIAVGPAGAVARAHGMEARTPLWFYVLREASVLADGDRLGPVGATLLAEASLDLIQADPGSFMAQRANWAPELPAAAPGTFSMADLLRFVDDVNPIGGA
ncbi:MAG: peroxidase family protein, partial [Pseudomonadota bacterium]